LLDYGLFIVRFSPSVTELVRGGESNTRAERLAVQLYRLTIKAPPHNLPPRYNICPTDPVEVVTERDGNRDFVRMRWGLVPAWWPKPLKELKAATFSGIAHYNEVQPHKALGYRSPREFIAAHGRP
jgi:putative SOS response-associated peptidase YedK